MDYETLRVIWWVLIGVLLIGFAVTDGFDLGVGALLRIIGKTDDERRVMINAIAPHWDGNQVWLITAGGALFAAWPTVYAASFSGFYLALMLTLFALFLRPIGFEYRAKIDSEIWRSRWDWALTAGSAIPALIFGVAFGNLLQGVPFGFDEYLISTYTGSFWQLLNPFALLAGVVSSAMITMQGGAYLAHRTEGVIQERTIKAATGAAWLMVAAFVGAGFWLQSIEGYRITSTIDMNALPDPMSKTVVREAGAWMRNYTQQPLLWLLPGLAVAGALVTSLLLRLRYTLSAFVTSSLALVGVIGTAGASMFPFVMPSSSMPNASLTVWDSASSQLTLSLMFWATVIFMPLIIGYTSWAYSVMRGKVTAAYIRENDHAAY